MPDVSPSGPAATVAGVVDPSDDRKEPEVDTAFWAAAALDQRGVRRFLVPAVLVVVLVAVAIVVFLVW